MGSTVAVRRDQKPGQQSGAWVCRICFLLGLLNGAPWGPQSWPVIKHPVDNHLEKHPPGTAGLPETLTSPVCGCPTAKGGVITAGVTSPSWRHFPLGCPSGGPHSWSLSALPSIWKNGRTGQGILEFIGWSCVCYHGARATGSFNFLTMYHLLKLIFRSGLRF